MKNQKFGMVALGIVLMIPMFFVFKFMSDSMIYPLINGGLEDRVYVESGQAEVEAAEAFVAEREDDISLVIAAKDEYLKLYEDDTSQLYEQQLALDNYAMEYVKIQDIIFGDEAYRNAFKEKYGDSIPHYSDLQEDMEKRWSALSESDRSEWSKQRDLYEQNIEV